MLLYILLVLLLGVENQASINEEDGVWQPPSIQLAGLRLLNGTIDKSVWPHPYRPFSRKLILVCEGGGKPEPVYRWQKNGIDLQTDAYTTFEDGNLTILRPLDQHEGIYQCFSRNNYGTAASQKIILRKVYLEELGSDERIIEMSVSAGDSVEFPCFFNSSYSYPDPKYSWQTLDGSAAKDINLGNRYVVDDRGTLYIGKVNVEDANTYECFVRNHLIGGHPVPTKHKLLVTAGSDFSTSPVPWIPKPQDKEKIFIAGQTLTLHCLFKGNPMPSVEWSLPQGIDANRVKFHNSNTVLKVHGIKIEDGGNYVCSGKNIRGTATQTIKVETQFAPVFVKAPADIVVVERQDVSFQCLTSANPPVQKESITWMINTVPIVSDSHNQYHLSEDRVTLTFRKVCKVNCGPDKPPGGDLRSIQCNASNLHGYAFASVSLNVIEPTTFLLRPKDIYLDLTESEPPQNVRFDCGAKFDPSTSLHQSISWRHEELWLPREDSPRLKVEHINSSYCILLVQLTGSKDSDWNLLQGTFTCVASNGLKGTQAFSEIHAAAKLTISSPFFLTPGEIAGIAVGIFILVIIVVMVVFLVCRRCNGQSVWSPGRKNSGNGMEGECRVEMKKISELNASTSTEQQASTTHIGIASNPSRRIVSYYHERKELKKRCLSKLKSRHHLNLKGIRGSGKTQLARDVVNHLQNICKGFEVDGSTNDVFIKGVVSLIKKLIQPEFYTDDFTEALETLSKHQVVDNVIVIIDDVTHETKPIVEEFILTDTNFKVITTAKENLYNDDITETVDGFTKDEALAFYKENNPSRESEADIEYLCDILSNMPLALAIAKSQLKVSPMTIREYINQHILTRSKQIEDAEYDTLKENEYNKNQISAVQEGVEKTIEKLAPHLRKAFRILAYMNQNNFCISKLVGMLADENDEKGLTKSDIHLIMTEIEHSCIGFVYKEDERCFVDMHSIVQVAIRHRRNEASEITMLENALVFLTHVSDLDARSDDRTSWIPHLEAALKLADFYHDRSSKCETKIIHFARIKLHLALGHRYAEQNEKAKHREHITKALEDYQSCFLKSEGGQSCCLTDKDVCEMSTKEMKKLGTKLINQQNINNVGKLIIGRVVSKEDAKLWKECSRSLQVPSGDLPRLTKLVYKELQKHSLAISEDQMAKVSIAWLLCTALYQYARLYIYIDPTDRNSEVQEKYKHAMDLAQALATVIARNIKFGVCCWSRNPLLFEQFLIKRYSCYLLLDDIGTLEDQLIKAENVKSEFLTLRNNTYSYFEDGLMKMSSGDIFNKIVCTRQLVRTYCKILKCTDEEQQEIRKEDAYNNCKEWSEEILNKPTKYPYLRLHVTLQSEFCRLCVAVSHIEEAFSHFVKALAKAIEQKRLSKVGPGYLQGALQELLVHLADHQKNSLSDKILEYMNLCADIREREAGQKLLDMLTVPRPQQEMEHNSAEPCKGTMPEESEKGASGEKNITKPPDPFIDVEDTQPVQCTE